MDISLKPYMQGLLFPQNLKCPKNLYKTLTTQKLILIKIHK